MALRRYVMTTRRKASLRKAQLASARKRKGRGKKVVRNAALAGGTAAIFGGAAYGGYRNSKGYKAKKIDKIVEKRWGVKGTEVNGLRLPDLNKPGNPVFSEAQIKQQEALRRLSKPVEHIMVPNDIDEKVFNESAYVWRQGREGRFKGPHTGEEIRRAKRNRYANKTNDKYTKTINYREARRRTKTYEATMRAKGIKLSDLHLTRVMDRYSQMKGIDY